MPTTINASNTTGGAVVTGDGSGILELQSGGVTGITVNGPNVTVAGTLTATGGISALTTPVIVTGSSTAGAEIRLPEDTDNGSNYVAIKAPDALAANVTFTLPTADGTNGQYLQTNGSGQLAFATPSGVGNSYTEFLVSGTWTKPAGVTWIYVEAIGGGGGGRSSAFSGNTCTGGGGGEFTSQLMLASTVGATVSVTVGTGGAGGTAGGNDGSAGGTSSFGSVVTARGGGGGQALSASYTLGIPGSSGFATPGAGLLFPQAGFAGSSNGVGGNTIYGGAGGGGCNGSATRAGGTSTYGGAGGAGGTSAGGGPGAAGSVPGGGGGASGDSVSAAGAGGAGRVRVWAW